MCRVRRGGSSVQRWGKINGLLPPYHHHLPPTLRIINDRALSSTSSASAWKKQKQKNRTCMLSYPRYPWAHAIKHNMETFQACQDSSRTGKKYPSFVGCNETEGCSFQVITLRFMKWGDPAHWSKMCTYECTEIRLFKVQWTQKCLSASVVLLEKLLFWQVIMKWDVLWQHHSVGGDKTSTDTSCIIGFASFFYLINWCHFHPHHRLPSHHSEEIKCWSWQ